MPQHPPPVLGSLLVPANGSHPGWTRAPWPGDEIPRSRRDYALDLIAHLTNRSITYAAARVVSRIVQDGLSDETDARNWAWEYVRHTAIVRHCPYLGLGFITNGPPGIAGSLQQGYVQAVLAVIQDHYGIDYRHPRPYANHPGYDGVLFRSTDPEVPRPPSPWSWVAAGPGPSQMDNHCTCAVCAAWRARNTRPNIPGPLPSGDDGGNILPATDRRDVGGGAPGVAPADNGPTLAT